MIWHTVCIIGGRRRVAGTTRLGEFTHRMSGPDGPPSQSGGYQMKWTKPEAEVVAVTMEVTAYVATL